jgi:hypothetical protein
MAKQQEKLEAMAAVMEGLASELRKLAVMVDDEEPRMKAAPSSSPKKRSKRQEMGVGSRVRVTVKGPYCGRTGLITSRRGLMYWNLRLDDPVNARDPYIYKMRSSLEVIDD